MQHITLLGLGQRRSEPHFLERVLRTIVRQLLQARAELSIGVDDGLHRVLRRCGRRHDWTRVDHTVVGQHTRPERPVVGLKQHQLHRALWTSVRTRSESLPTPSMSASTESPSRNDWSPVGLVPHATTSPVYRVMIALANSTSSGTE